MDRRVGNPCPHGVAILVRGGRKSDIKGTSFIVRWKMTGVQRNIRWGKNLETKGPGGAEVEEI